MRFTQKVVLISGGSSDIGALTAVSFAREGASIAIVGTNGAKLKKIAQRCEKLGAAALAIKADLSEDEEADLIVKKTIEKYGKLDVLVNHAEEFREAGILANHFLKTYSEVMNTNMQGAIRITYFAVPHLIKTKGNIINVSSMDGISTTRTSNIAYRTSKAAMFDFTKSIALELDIHGVRANMISPGPDRDSIVNKLKINIERNSRPQRLTDPSEIVDMILYVASDKGKDITGSNFWLKLWTDDDKKNIELCNSIIDIVNY